MQKALDIHPEQLAILACPDFGRFDGPLGRQRNESQVWIRRSDDCIEQVRAEYLRYGARRADSADAHRQFVADYQRVCGSQPPFADKLPFRIKQQLNAVETEYEAALEQKSANNDEAGELEQKKRKLEEQIRDLENQYSRVAPVQFLVTGRVQDRKGELDIIWGVAWPLRGDALNVEGSEIQKTHLLMVGLEKQDYQLSRLVYSRRLYYIGVRTVRDREIPAFSPVRPAGGDEAKAAALDEKTEGLAADVEAIEERQKELRAYSDDVYELRKKRDQLKLDYQNAKTYR